MGSSLVGNFRAKGFEAKSSLLRFLFANMVIVGWLAGSAIAAAAQENATPIYIEVAKVETPVAPASASTSGEQDFPGNRPAMSAEQVLTALPAQMPRIPKNIWEAGRGQVSVLNAIRAARAASGTTKYDAKYDVSKIGDRGVGKGMNFYSIEKEVRLGRELAADVEANAKLFKDEAINEYVNRLAQNLVRNSDAKVMFTVKVIDSDEVNAFALPGGFFFVNVGMLMAAENEAELAGVMAHEIAHVAARHATKNATKKDIWNIISIPLVFVGGPAGMIVQNVANFAVPMSFLKFNRNAEREADLLGLEYQYAAGYDPSAMIAFFERLGGKEKKQNFLVRAFSTHPMNEDRVKRSQKTMETLLPPSEQYLVTTSDFEEMKARLAMLTAGRARLGAEDAGGPTLRKKTDGDEKNSSEKDDDVPVLKRK
ncbi:MAG: M48 family metallopeptidase [Terriglobales bacterium]